MIQKSDQCPASRPYAVIKETDGSVEGCHESQEAAEKQVAALNIAESEESRKYEDINFTPPEGVRREAKKGLAWREEHGRGGTAVGVARARDLSNGTSISPSTAKRMKSYFARHEVDKQGQGWSPGEEGWPSAGRIAWSLWGGTPGQRWANKLVRQMDAEDNRSADMSMERRDFEYADEDKLVVEQRSDGTPVIRGYAVMYNRLSVPLGGFRERIMPGAFDEVLNRSEDRVDLVSYFNHDANIMLGRESSGTLRVWSDDRGVGFEVNPPKSREDILELVSRGDVKGASFTFQLRGPNSENWVEEDGMPIREVRSASIYELGPVVQPAYPETSVSVAQRSLEAWMAQQDVSEVQERAAFPSVLAKIKAAILRSL
tara:strand:- start:123 stop:1241 length:1119 start_codon:yes stop_codon:yes gene_type:complete